MDIKGFIQLFNTKWSNTNLHYSKSAYSSYAIALVLCETWTNLSEHSRQPLKLPAEAIPEGPFQSTAWPHPLWLSQTTAARHRAHPPEHSSDSSDSPAQPRPPRAHSPPRSLSSARQAPGRQGTQMGAPLKRVFSQLSVKDKLEVNIDKLN